ncbi:hypothetical protein BU23DRAFT_271013 [Bimuria novae-zelandiae CBS 107.79]|uniref:BTB domain-containing protein n=1 Tax=Bimuria novae-zelandiae CBS 107.79 TaxID=1447943 RepID=A0A6A5VWU4_9PLEO|nr:hypothetical protein BU23DRAFT_271013 [Bimuria novae-zelandiae CBS 107.79]
MTIDRDDIPAAELDPREEIEVHPKGNLILQVGGKSLYRRVRRLIVQSDNIGNFGSRWAAAVARSEREGLFSRRRILHLPNDDANMMLVLMWLSHPWHMGKVPKQLSFRQLLAMTSLCEKYDMNLQVSPFIRRWIVPHQSKLLVPGREQWLNIAYQFGLERHYITLASHLMMNCRADKEGDLLVPGRHEKLADHIPEEALVEIRRRRIQALAAFFNVVYIYVEAMENEDTCQAKLPLSPHEEIQAVLKNERTMCTHTNHGELVRYLKSHGYWPPITQAHTVPMSVNEVFQCLIATPSIRFRPVHNKSLQSAEAPSSKDTPPRDIAVDIHYYCDVGKVLAFQLNEVKGKLEMPITRDTTDAMRVNAETSGLQAEIQKEGILPSVPNDEQRR